MYIIAAADLGAPPPGVMLPSLGVLSPGTGVDMINFLQNTEKASLQFREKESLHY